MAKKDRIEAKRLREKRTVAEMIALYCRKHHAAARAADGLCPQCRELLTYAEQRSDRCPLMENKTFCSNCTVHCYKPAMRERIRTVMRFSGPRLIRYHPVLALRHLITAKREKHRQTKQ